MYKLFMALRYLASHRIIYFSIAGVAIGIAVIIVVMSVMGGFSRDIRERIRGMQAHLVVKGISNDILILDYDRLTDRISKLPHVRGAAPRVEYVAWMGVRGREMDVHLVGIDPARERGASQLQMFFEKGGKRDFNFNYDGGEAPAYPGIVVGIELGRVAAPREIPGLTTVRRETRPRICNANFEVVGKFNSGMVEYDTGFIFMDLAAAQKFLKYRCVHEPEVENCPECRQRPAVSYIAVMVDDYEANARAVRQSILQLLHAERSCRSPEMHRYGWCGLYEIRTWEEQKATLLRAVSIEKGIQVVILFCIIVVAGFNIIAFYTLMVKAKTREIGILRALGSNRAGIAQVFLTSGFLCGLFGSIIGIIVGLKVSYNLNDVAEWVEQTSREQARWARETPEAFLVKNGAALGIAATGALLGIGQLAILFRRKRMIPFLFRWVFGSIAIGLAAKLLLVMLVDALGVVGLGEAPVTRVLEASQWILIAVFVVSYGAALVVETWCSDPSRVMRPWRSSLVWALRGLVGIMLAIVLIRFVTRSPSWETFFGEILFDVVGALGAIVLLRVMLRYPKNLVLPVISYLGALSAAMAMIPLAMFWKDPPGPGWPGLNLFPKDVYYLDRIPAEVNYPSILFVVLATMIVSIAATLYPAVRAAMCDPIEAIRRE